MTQRITHSVLGWWRPETPVTGSGSGSSTSTTAAALQDALFQLARPLYLCEHNGQYVPGERGSAVLGASSPAPDAWPLIAFAPAVRLRHLGDPEFCADYHLRYPYIAGAMANGIASAAMVEAMGQHGMVGFFGAAGLTPPVVEAAIERMSCKLGEQPYGVNLIHSPHDPSLEAAMVDLYLRRGVHLVSAAAYLQLTLPVVRYRVHGIHRDAGGRIVTPNHLFAKVSRQEIAARFFAPPPDNLLRELVNQGEMTDEQAQLAEQIPMAQNLTAEANSGGHTDNRLAITLLPTMLALRDRMQVRYGYDHRLRVGAAGGIATPAAAAAAFAMGAAYILTGSINQACVEAGTCKTVRRMLADTQQADVAMAPSADMFEIGARVQVLKRGTMFAMRAAKLRELYQQYDCLEDIPPADRELLEQKILRESIAAVWQQTREFFAPHDPGQIERAERDPKHKMALVFRWYLGQASRWANTGVAERKIDYQIWCGPAMGAFNEWVKGSFLESPDNRRVVTVALNLLYGAGMLSRLNVLRWQGVVLPPAITRIAPVPLSALEARVAEG
jgi:trans-AT polyketide synthase, acyltransferase and oxidoreductase domains